MISSKKQSLLRALAQELGRKQQPVITSYQLGKLIFNAYVHNSIGDVSLNLKKSLPEKTQYNSVLSDMLNNGVLTKFSGLSGNYFNSNTTTEAGGNFNCSVFAFKTAPLKGKGFIFSGLSNEL